MSDRLFRLRLSDGTTWAVVGDSLEHAQRKAELYFPNAHVRIEESRDGGPWRTVDPCCQRCGAGDVMAGLGRACAVFCGTDRYPEGA